MHDQSRRALCNVSAHDRTTFNPALERSYALTPSGLARSTPCRQQETAAETCTGDRGSDTGEVVPHAASLIRAVCYLLCDFLRDDFAVLDDLAAARFFAVFAPLFLTAVLRVFFTAFVLGLLAAGDLRPDDLDLDFEDLDPDDLRADDR